MACLMSKLLTMDAFAASDIYNEYEVKAAFLFNFISFVEWPASVFPDADSPFNIGILGTDPFGQSLAQIIKGEKFKGRPLVIVRSQDIGALLACQIVFIPSSEMRDLRQILKQVEKKPILTVGEKKGFASHGGIINFCIRDEQIKLEINPKVARSAGLKIAAQLLSLSRIVDE